MGAGQTASSDAAATGNTEHIRCAYISRSKVTTLKNQKKPKHCLAMQSSALLLLLSLLLLQMTR